MHITLTKKGFFYLFSIKVFHIPNEMHGANILCCFSLKFNSILLKTWYHSYKRYQVF